MDATVPHQFFAASMLAMPLLRGVLGWEPDAPSGRATLAPQMPPEWGLVRVRRLKVGRTELNAVLERTSRSATTRITASGPPITLDLVQSLPPGAQDIRVELPDVDDPEYTVDRGRHDVAVRVTVPLDGRQREVRVLWDGGLTIGHPAVALEAGQNSRGLRVVDFGPADGGWELVLEGAPGAEYALPLYGGPVEVAEGDAEIPPDSRLDRSTLMVTFPELEGATRVVREIRLAPVSR